MLIADDESQLLRVLVRAFEKQGYSVVPATDGKAAIDLLRATPATIDAIVLDAAIGPSGAGAVLEVLAAEQPQIAVIVTSGDQLSTAIRCHLRAHSGVFLLKPFAPSALLQAVEARLRGEGAE